MWGLTTLGTMHAVLASTGIIIGLPQILRRTGGIVHRTTGYAYVAAMSVADGSALLIFQFTGRPNVLHVGALVNLLCIAAGLWPVFSRPRPIDWPDRHRVWMARSYIGLLAAAATELTVRTVHFPSSGDVWAATGAVTLLVWLGGRFVVRRTARSSAG